MNPPRRSFSLAQHGDSAVAMSRQDDSKSVPPQLRSFARAGIGLAALSTVLLLGTAITSVFAAEGGTIRTVVLSSGGLAAISRSVPVDGQAAIRIEVPLDQVDDLLKSLVVGDPAGTVS